MSDGFKITGSYRDMREADRAVLDDLVRQGDDLSQTRHTLLYFYAMAGRPRPSFDEIIESGAGRGLSVSRVDDESLVIEGSLKVDSDAVIDFVDWASELAQRTGVEFDGWECAVVTGRH